MSAGRRSATLRHTHKREDGLAERQIFDDDDWIVCRAAPRPVRNDRVECPVTGFPMAVTACLACHHLVAIADERHPRHACTTAATPELGVRAGR